MSVFVEGVDYRAAALSLAGWQEAHPGILRDVYDASIDDCTVTMFLEQATA